MKLCIRILSFLIPLTACLLFAFIAYAQVPGGPPLPPGGGTAVPIDGSAAGLLVIGIGLAIRQYLKSEEKE